MSVETSAPPSVGARGEETPETRAVASGKKKRTKVRRDPVTVAIVAIISAVLVLLVLLPLVTILARAFSGEGMKVLTSFVSSKTNRTIALNTIVLGLVVGLVGTLVGFFFAYIQARVKIPGKKILHLICLIPIVSPPFAVATSAITLFGRNGIISTQLLGQQWNIYGLSGLTLVLSLSFFPVAYMNMLGMLKNLDPAMEEAAASLGASSWKIFRTVTLPMLIPGFAASFLLLFVEAIADLANPLVIGGDFTVLASRAYIAVNGEYNTAAGSAYSLILLVPALLVFLLQRYWSGRSSAVTVTGKPAGRVRMVTSLAARIPLGAVTAALALFVVTIYATVIVGAFVSILGVDNTFTLKNFKYVLSGIGNDAMVDTTILALIATPIAGVLGMIVAWLVVVRLKASSGFMDFLGMLGLSVPGTVLGIGYLITYNKPIIIDDDRLVVGDEVTDTQDGTGHRQTEHTEEVHEARGSLQTHDNQPRDDHAKHASNRRSNQGQDGRIHHRIVTDTREHVLEVLESEGIVNAQDRDECTHNNRRVNRHNEKCQRGSHCAQRNASGKRSHHANAASGLTGHGHR